MKLVCFQIQTLFKKKEFYISTALFSVFVILNYVYYVKQTHGCGMDQLMAPYEYDALSDWGNFEWYFRELFPFIAVIASGFGFYNDYRSGEGILMECRMGQKKYYVTKCIAIFVVGMSAFVIPFLGGLLLDALTFPDTLGYPQRETVYSAYYYAHSDSMGYGNLYLTMPWLYHIGEILSKGIMVGMISVFVSLFAFFGFRYKILFFLPFYLFTFLLDIAEKLTGRPFGFSNYIMSENTYLGKIIGFEIVIDLLMFLFVIIVSRRLLQCYPIARRET